jgi:hypothetical protein
MGLPPVRRPRDAERALALLDTTHEERLRLSAEMCDDAAVCLRTYAAYAERVRAFEEARRRILSGKELVGCEMKLAVLCQLTPRVGDVARAFEGLANTKRRGMGGWGGG